jgi:hypothetical protein
MRALLTAALAALVAGAAAASDSGTNVTFSATHGARFSVTAQGAGARVLFESGVSDPIPDAWDTVLIQGELPDPGVVFQVQRADAGLVVGTPSAWTDLELHRYGSGRFWGKARLPKAAGPLSLRALDAGVLSDHTVEVYAVEVFVDEPAQAGAPAVPPRGPADPTATRPLVHTRAEWGAVTPAQPYSPDPLPWRATLHHSDGKYTRTLDESKAEARFIQDFHIHGRGWNDIGYHFLVDSVGNILEGRPEGVLGAHTLGNNEGNVGIVLLGNYHPPKNDKPTKAQLEAVASIGRYLVARYGIDPKSLRGHRDYKGTDCPGDQAYAKLDWLRLAFAGLPTPPLLVPRHSPRIPLAQLDAPSFD